MQICHVNRSFHDKANAQQYYKWFLFFKDNILWILGWIRSLSRENKEEENGVLPYNKGSNSSKIKHMKSVYCFYIHPIDGLIKHLVWKI